MIFLDSETSSPVDLTACGASKYFEHPETQPICISAALDMDKPFSITKDRLERGTLNHRVEQGEPIVVFNAEFEWGAFTKLIDYGWPPIKYDQLVDVAVMMRMLGLPHSLEGAARCVSMTLGFKPYVKDVEGRRLMKKFCTGDYWDDEEYKKVCRYCEQDVELTRFLYYFVPDAVKEEYARLQEDRQTSFIINQHGVCVDDASTKCLMDLSATEKTATAARMAKITRNEVAGPTKVLDIKRWIHEQTGDKYVSLSASVINDILTSGKYKDKPDVEEILALRRDGGRSSTAKFQKMLNAQCDDGRLRGMYVYWGAGPGRYSSKQVQIHNLPRESLCAPDEVFGAIDSPMLGEIIELWEGPILGALPKMLRPLFTASKGHKLVGGDYSQIEARMLALVAGEEGVLDTYRSGRDVYKDAAVKMFGGTYERVTENNRQAAKTTTLSCGYAGGKGAVASMAEKFGVEVDETTAQGWVDAWRKAHPKIVVLWGLLEKAVNDALANEGTKFSVSPNGLTTTYWFDGVHLYCKLPSSRLLTYPFVKYVMVDDPMRGPQRQLMCINGRRYARNDATEWALSKLWRGVYVENVIQGICADILIQAQKNCLRAGVSVAMHTHDSLALEVPIGFDVDITKLMSDVSNWAKGLPVGVDVWTGLRFQK